jgi:uncharacterized protein YdeI (YjbR/CyaY-like superfamily)
MPLDDLEIVRIDSREDLERWLAARASDGPSVWLAIAKKGQPEHVEYPQVVRALICWGWIDGLTRKLNEDRSLCLIAPRKPKSAWSQINRAYVDELEAAGSIQPAGWAAIERAKQDGSYLLLAEVDDQRIPADVMAVFDRLPGSLEAFEAFPKSARRAALEWIVLARTPETRARRAEEAAAKSLRGERPR